MMIQESSGLRVAIVGVGLIGGSISAAARRRGIAKEIIGAGRNIERLSRAQACGLIDRVATAPEELAESDVVVVCTPVDRIAHDVLRVLAATSSTTLVTDAGSIKGSIVERVSLDKGGSDRFVPAHPLAGSHRTGFENADPQLYQDRLCILTPTAVTRPEMVGRARQFWQSLGMRVKEMSCQEHDRILALTSHLPHLAASAVASIVQPEILEYAATGYRDTTRVAAGDPGLWTAIFSQNAAELISATDHLIDTLQKFRDTLSQEQPGEVQAFLQQARDNRQLFRDRDQLQHAE